MEINLLEMWHTMNPIVKSAVVVLTIQGIWGITVTVDRLLMLFMSKGGRATSPPTSPSRWSEATRTR